MTNKYEMYPSWDPYNCSTQRIDPKEVTWAQLSPYEKIKVLDAKKIGMNVWFYRSIYGCLVFINEDVCYTSPHVKYLRPKSMPEDLAMKIIKRGMYD